MIEKLNLLNENATGAIGAMADKINELVEAYNDHYHETLDTHYNTTGPKHENS